MNRRNFLKASVIAGSSLFLPKFSIAEEKSDFEKFAEKCLIFSSTKGWFYPTLWPHQVRLVNLLEDKDAFKKYTEKNLSCRWSSSFNENTHVIGSCFRQGGFSTLIDLFSKWKAYTVPNQQILIIKSGFIDGTGRPYGLSEFEIKKEYIRNSFYCQRFENGSTIKWTNDLDFCRGTKLDYLFIDQAAFIPDLEKKWQTLYPCLGRNAQCGIFSSLKEKPNIFDHWLNMTQLKRNAFVPYECDYKECPLLVEKELEFKTFLSKKEFALEYLQKRI